jgi:acylphosphatase
VAGRVQGVGFRYSTRNIGQRLGLAGWVRNRPDGSVEVWAQGDAESVAEFETFLKRGPRSARVDELTVTEVEPDPEYTRFEISF